MFVFAFIVAAAVSPAASQSLAIMTDQAAFAEQRQACIRGAQWAFPVKAASLPWCRGSAVCRHRH